MKPNKVNDTQPQDTTQFWRVVMFSSRIQNSAHEKVKLNAEAEIQIMSGCCKM